MPNMNVNRRTFVKTAGALGALAAVGGTAATGSLFEPTTPAFAEAPDEIHWSQCNVNCGGNCIFQWHSKDGKIQYMETDNLGSTDLQARACLRGRAMRRWPTSGRPTVLRSTVEFCCFSPPRIRLPGKMCSSSRPTAAPWCCSCSWPAVWSWPHNQPLHQPPKLSLHLQPPLQPPL